MSVCQIFYISFRLCRTSWFFLLCCPSCFDSLIFRQIFIGEVSMYVMKSTREALLAQEKTIVTGDCCYLNPLMRRIVRFIGEQQSSPKQILQNLVLNDASRKWILAPVDVAPAWRQEANLQAWCVQGRRVSVGTSHVVFVCRRCFCLRTVCHRHLCQRWPGGDRRPLALLPVCLQAQLHQQRVSLQPPVHHQRQHLHGEPGGGGERSPLLPIQGRLAERLLRCLRHGEPSRWRPELLAELTCFCCRRWSKLQLCSCFFLLQMYITSTIRTKSSRLAKPVLCLGTLCSAFLTGLNRVSEYRNHCSDVLAGFILGSAVALFLVRSITIRGLKGALVSQGVEV